MNQTERGAIAESIAATWALERGWCVLWPTRGQAPAYDLVMDAGDKLWRVQVKRAYLKEGFLTADLCHARHTRYTIDDIDIFLIVDVQSSVVWWLPIGESKGKGRVRLTTKEMEQYRETSKSRRF